MLDPMKSHYPRLVRIVERSLDGRLRLQCLDPKSRDYGGFVSPEQGYAEPAQSAHAVDALAALYCCPASAHFREARLLEAARLYAEHLLREQHEDGTIDLKATNFHDATCVGFAVQVLAYTLRLMRASAPGADPAGEAALAERILAFLRRGAEGMLSGGFHTPNHRWVMASALSLLYRTLGDDRCLREAQLYLGEGIDCTEDGEYTERSVGIYNVVNNRSLQIMADELGRPELLAHVRRNLDMVQRYLEPDGSLYTDNSRRQDMGKASYPASYYENYLLMAHATGEPVYAGMAEALLGMAEEGKITGDSIDRTLTLYLLRPELRERELPSVPPSPSYRLWNPRSGVARFCEGGVSLSLLRAAGGFLKLQAGGLSATVRVAATFYGSRGPFHPQTLERDGDWAVLRSRDRWGYVRPFREPPPTSDWDGMPHEKREQANMQDHVVEARARFTGDGVELRLASQGVPGVLFKLELLLSPGGWLETEGLRMPAAAGAWAALKGPEAVYTLGADRIAVRGGFAQHNSTVQMRGSEPQDMHCFTLCCTGYTPMDRTVEIRALRQGGPVSGH